MKRDQLITIPLAYPWGPDDLRHSFAAVEGGVSFPGKQPGFAVVCGLCGDLRELHVLEEAESPDLGTLLRCCRGMGVKYNISGSELGDPFRWWGDAKNAAGARIVDEINAEADHPSDRDRLILHSTPIREMGENAYPYCFAVLHGATATDEKTLYLHGSAAAHAMRDSLPQDVPFMRFGDLPAVEALAAVVVALRERGQQIVRDRTRPLIQRQTAADLFGRSRYYAQRSYYG